MLVRSPYPHARIRGIDTAAAAAAPGVLAVLTGEDVVRDKLGFIPHNIEWQGPPDVILRLVDGFDVQMSDHPTMPHDIVRYLG